MTDKLKMHSLNKVDENIEKIGKLFPNCITERKNENGEVEYAIDFDMLKQELSSVVVGAVVYFLIRAIVLDFGLNTNDMNLFTALFVAAALSIPVFMAKYHAKHDYSETVEEDEV